LSEQRKKCRQEEEEEEVVQVGIRYSSPPTQNPFLICPDVAEESPDVRISKRMSYFLRHHAKEVGLPIRPDGFVPVDALLALKDFKVNSFDRYFCCLMRVGYLYRQGVVLADLQRIVDSDSKTRYCLQDVEGVLCVRANQGHSIPVRCTMGLHQRIG
jgi:2'-phosphotransferase